MVVALNPRRRRRRKNTWKGHKRAHRRAARKGWRCRRRRRAHNGRRRHRSRRRNGNYTFAYNRHRRRNGMMQDVKAGFSLPVLKNAGIIVVGSVLNNWLTVMASKYIPVNFLKTSPGNYVVSLVAAGLTLGAASSVGALRPFAAPLFFGGIVDVVSRAMNKYAGSILPGGRLLQGLSDYLTVGDASRATPLGYLGDDDGMEGMEDMGDYLTVGDASRATPLGYLPGVYLGDGSLAVGEELESAD